MSLKKFLYLLLAAIAIISGSCSGQDVRRKIMRMQSKPIVIRADKMICLSKNDADYRKKPLKWVSFHDTITCKPCQMSHISDWNHIMETKGVGCCFVLSAKPCEVGKYVEAYQNTCYNTKACVYLDTAGFFVHDNPRVPQEALFQEFLMDEKNKVLLVGNPVRNGSVHELFIRILNEKEIDGLYNTKE